MHFNRPPHDDKDVHFTPAPDSREERVYVKEKVSNWTQIVLAIIGVFMLSNPWEYMDSLTERWFTTNNQRMEIEAEKRSENEKIQAWKDSILDIEIDRWEAQQYRNQNQILEELRNYQRIIDSETHISVVKIKGEDTLQSVYFKDLSILYTTDQIAVTDIQNDWQERPVPGGYAWLFNEAIKSKSKYIPDIRNEPMMYFGKAKQYSDFIGTIGHISSFIKMIPIVDRKNDEYYLVSASFSQADPMASDPLLDLKMENLAESLEPLINKTPNHLIRN